MQEDGFDGLSFYIMFAFILIRWDLKLIMDDLKLIMDNK
jgi:hypothetical protein